MSWDLCAPSAAAAPGAAASPRAHPAPARRLSHPARARTSPRRSLHWPWLTATIAGVIVVWWLLFLVVNPRLFDEYVQEAEREGRDWMLEMDLGPELSEKIRAKKQAAAGR